MPKKLKKFRQNEKPSSIEFTKKLNDLVKEVERANNIHVNVKGGTGGISHRTTGHDININLRKLTGSGTTSTTGGSSSTIDYFWGVVVQTLSYDTAGTDGNCYYKVIDIDDYDAWVEDPESVTIYTPQIYNNYYANPETEIVTDAFRDFVPWLRYEQVVPVIGYLLNDNPSGASTEIDYDNLFILANFSYTGNAQVKSITWDEDAGRIKAVYR